MARIVALINKETLSFICASRGVSADFLARKLKLPTDQVGRWLDANDRSLPTFNQAKEIAHHLHVPFAGLYMNKEDVPTKYIPHFKNMRTLHNRLSFDDSAINIAISDALIALDFLLNENDNLGISQQPYAEIPTIYSDSPILWAEEIRKYLGASLEEQFNFSSTRKFYLYLRNKVENRGIFIYCFYGVPVEDIRGFALYDKIHPIIGLNTDDRYPAKTFSIIHELVHLIKRESSLCNDIYSSFTAFDEEVFCNAVAGELLVPRDALALFLTENNFSTPYSLSDIEIIAQAFSVSKEVILRRLLDNGYIGENEYNTYNKLLKNEIEQQKEQKRTDRNNGLQTQFSQNMSLVAVDRTSISICKTLYAGYAADVYSKIDLANYLGIKLNRVDGFLREVAQWNK